MERNSEKALFQDTDMVDPEYSSSGRNTQLSIRLLLSEAQISQSSPTYAKTSQNEKKNNKKKIKSQSFSLSLHSSALVLSLLQKTQNKKNKTRTKKISL